MDLTFLWIVLVTADYCVFHSLLAANPIKNAVKRQYPALHDRFYRLFYNIIAVVTLIPIGVLLYLLPDRMLYTIPSPFNLAAIFIQMVAVIGAYFTLRATGIGDFLGLYQAVGLPHGSRPLKTDGLYRLARHPVYTLGFIFMWLLPWMTSNRLALFITLSIYLVIGAHLEERRMLLEFGEAYARYRERTPMFFPDPRTLFK